MHNQMGILHIEYKYSAFSALFTLKKKKQSTHYSAWVLITLCDLYTSYAQGKDAYHDHL